MLAILAFLGKHFITILISLITAGALAYCKHLHSKVKYYKSLECKEKENELDTKIDEKIAPVLNEIEELREYIRKTDLKEKKDI